LTRNFTLALCLLLSKIAYTISPDQDQLILTEGKSVTMRCNYQTDYNGPWLYWYKHDSDLQAPQFILWKGAKDETSEHIPDKRYGSTTTDTSTELIITKLTLADTALYYSSSLSILKTQLKTNFYCQAFGYTQDFCCFLLLSPHCILCLY
uniref:Ig-like domain-containing protein n=1 Tax=Oryzias melastigma TaxID=30732 RepID=A0A3B3D6P3_ORYME